MAGRVTLVKTVLSFLLIYLMQLLCFPVQVCNTIDRLNRSFLWNHEVGQQKVHLVSWDVICKCKYEGGFGVRRAQVLNEALLMKLSWRFAHSPHNLWVRLLKSKYNISRNFWSFNAASGPGICKSLKHGTTLLKEGLSWRIGNGSSVNFWIDRWCVMVPFADQYSNKFDIQWELKVANVLKNGG